MKSDDPYLLIKNILFLVDNSSSLQTTFREADPFKFARRYCYEVELGIGNDLMPTTVRQNSSVECVACGRECIKVGRSAQVSQEVVCFIAPYSVRASPTQLFTDCIDVDFMGNVCVMGKGIGKWPLHSAFCLKDRPEDERLAHVWDQCEADHDAKCLEQVAHLSRLDSMKEKLGEV